MVAAIIGLGAATGYSTPYSYTGPATGFAEAALTPMGLGHGDFVADFVQLSEEMYYNPAAETLEAVGSVTLSPSVETFSISGISAAPGFGTANLTLGNNGSVAFDMTFHYEYSAQNGPVFDSTLSIPVSGYGTFNEEKYSANWELEIPIVLQITQASPTSINFSQVNTGGATQGTIVVPGTDLVDGNDDTTYEYRWGVSGVATTVPEPTTLALIAMTLVPIALWRGRSR